VFSLLRQHGVFDRRCGPHAPSEGYAESSCKKGVSHGGVISPLLSNLYLSEVDKMLERRARSREMASTPTSNMRGSLTIW
jgi:hypothetical protein